MSVLTGSSDVAVTVDDAAAAEVAELIAAAVPTSPEAELALYEQEAAQPGEPGEDPRRQARLVHQMGALRERRLHNAREAGRLYTQSLTADPTLQANTWALYRLFSARGAWDNLLRLLEAELRFAPLPSARDRADVLVEKGRLLEDRLGRPADARAAYRAALEADPGHAAALLCLLLAALETQVPDEVAEALGGLGKLAQEPRLRALFSIELARVQRGPLEDVDSDGLRRSADTLFRALLDGAAEEPIGEELDRLSLASGDAGLRARVLDMFDSRLGRDEGTGAGARSDPAFLVALHREKARSLSKRGAREAALAVLERGLGMVPGHPLLIADLLDLAEEVGRADTIARLIEGGAVREGSYRHHEALLRRAEVASRVGALGEAIGSLEQIPESSRLFPLAWLARVRVVARLGDGEALARLFAEQAERLVTEASGAAPGGAEIAEAAHLLTRAAAIHGEEGSAEDLTAAAGLLRRALELVPGFPAAREGLRDVLGRRTEFRELATLYEEEAAGTEDPARKRRLRQSLHLLQRDLVRDGEAARRIESELGEPVDELVALTRAADEAGERFVSKGEGAEEAIPHLRTLSERAGQGEVAAGLRLLAADVAASAGAERSAIALAEEAFRCDPRSPAAAALEQRHRAAGRSDEALKVLLAELEAQDRASSETGAPDEVTLTLRFRAALCAPEAGNGNVEQALALLEPLRARGESAAILLSWDICREAVAPGFEATLLQEPAVVDFFRRQSPLGDARRLLALAEGAGFEHDTNAVTIVAEGAPDRVVPLADKRAVARAVLDAVVDARTPEQERS